MGDGDLAGIGLAAGFVVDVEGEAVKLIAVDLRRNFEGICLGGGEGSDGDDETRCNRLPTTHGTTPNPTMRCTIRAKLESYEFNGLRTGSRGDRAKFGRRRANFARQIVPHRKPEPRFNHFLSGDRTKSRVRDSADQAGSQRA